MVDITTSIPLAGLLRGRRTSSGRTFHAKPKSTRLLVDRMPLAGRRAPALDWKKEC
jgi:hypothetical protein